MSLLKALRLVLGDLGSLFPRTVRGEWSTKVWYFLLVAVVCQAGFWWLSTPGPNLIRHAPFAPDTALSGVVWAAVTLLALPGLMFILVGGSPAAAGMRVGDARFGFAAVGACTVVAIPVLALASGDASLQATYPWAGSWVGGSVGRLLGWAVVYAVYYVAFEAFYRGFLLHAVAAAWGRVAGLWVQALCATLIHLGKPLPEMLAAAPASLLFGVIALRSRSIVYPALLHLVVGLTIDVFVLARQGLLFP
ncbi:MAG: CPBP family intramembrane metalloprotease [Trueperaceae bacterium]|nr:CPBP family intramembrane metalloprotease [Trueperaceae bacterium]